MPKQKRGLKAIPEFRSEGAERRFWETHDSTQYVDWSKAEFVRFPNLKPSTETISLRLPAPLLDDLKALANKRDVPYQSLLKVYVADRVAAEWQVVRQGGALSNTYQPSPGQVRRSSPSSRRLKKMRDRKR